MKKKTASKSAFFNPRVLTGVGICVMGAFVALFALARQNEPAQSTQRQGTPPSERLHLTAQAYDESMDLPQPVSPPLAPVKYDAPSAVFVVNTTADTQDAVIGDGICADSGGNCSLRAAISEANSTVAADTITLPAGTYITTLAGVDDTNAGGDYDITQSLTINGAGSGTTFLQAAAAPNTGTQRVLHVINTTAAITVNISDLTIRYGNETTSTAGGGARVTILPASTVTFNNCVLDQNRVAPPAGNNAFGGGMIHSNPSATSVAGTVNMTNCTISNNSAVATNSATVVNGFAGGVYNQQATLNLTNSTVTGNLATSFHGGIRALASTTGAASTTLTNCTVSGNTARGNNGAGSEGEGGGLTNINGSTFTCTLTVNSSTISGNFVQLAGANGAGTVAAGVENVSASTGSTILNMTNSTVSSNLGADGGAGIYSGGTNSAANLNYCTVAGNTATSLTTGFGGGGVWHDGSAGTVTLTDTIVGDNSAPAGPDIFGTGAITSGTYNHIENTSGGTFAPLTGDVTGSDAQLSTLGGYGGPTFVHMPGAASPVLNTIPSGTNGCGTTVLVDQRGFGHPRPAGGACEKGSVERGAGDGNATPSPTPSQTPTATATATATATSTATFTPIATQCTDSENFGNVAPGLINGGWEIINHSQPGPGSTSWFQGNSTVFPAHLGAPDSYAGANFNAGSGVSTLSDWLILPPTTLQNGAQLSFFTRTTDPGPTPAAGPFPDRLQVRMSQNGASTNVGTTATDVGDFTTLLLDINPTYTVTTSCTATNGSCYPTVWTQFTVNLTGISGSPKGRIAFRYFVESGGTGANSDYIGIDTVGYNCAGIAATPTPPASPSPTLTPTPTPCLTSLTQSFSQSPTPGSASCNSGSPNFFHTDNSYWRAFNMAQYTNSGQYNVTSVTFAIETANATGISASPSPGTPTPTPPPTPGTQPVTVRLYTNAGGAFPAGTRTQIASQQIFVANQTGTLVTVPMSVVVPAGTSELVMEVFTPSGQVAGNEFFIGSNGLGELGPSYISATECAISTPATTGSIGFPNMQLIFDVNGVCASPTPSVVPIDGRIGQCNNVSSNALDLNGATVTVTGGAGGSTVTAGTGTYTISLAPGINYTLTPSKAARIPGSAGITTTDVVAIQRHFLLIGTPLSGCRLTAADCASPPGITTGDVIATQRFFLLFTSGIGNVGKYSFSPAIRTYTPLSGAQTLQNYDAVVFGDVATPFANPRPGGPGGDAPETRQTIDASITLPDVSLNRTAVLISPINASSNLVGFQADFTYDERVVSFPDPDQPVHPAGLTATWNVSGHVLPGQGPIKTVRVSAYSNDFTPLVGSGILFELNATRVSDTARGASLNWVAGENGFMFVDADLNELTPISGNNARGRQ